METKTADIEPAPAGAAAAPPAPMERPQAAAAPEHGSEDERSAAEIARLSSWATGECGGPILAD